MTIETVSRRGTLQEVILSGLQLGQLKKLSLLEGGHSSDDGLQVWVDAFRSRGVLSQHGGSASPLEIDQSVASPL